MVVRANLNSTDEAEKTECRPLQEVGTNMPPRGSPSYPRYEAHFDVIGAQRAQQREIVDATIRERNEKVKELRHHGWSYHRIVKQLGISIGTVWNAVHAGDKS